MAPSDADAIRAVYERWAQGDFWTPEIFDPHVRTVWIEEMPGLNESRGVEALGATVRTWLEAWEHCSIAAESIHADGDRVLVAIHAQARHRDSPAVMDLHGAHVWTMRDGRATALQAYASVQEAAAAAGICLE